MTVQIITPDKAVFESDTVESIKLPGVNGEFEVLNNHAALISALKAGKVRIKLTDKKEENFNIDSGVVEVLNNTVVVLSEALL